MRTALYVVFLFLSTLTFAQECDCEQHLGWVKKTLEDNDAGFEYVLNYKGKGAYESHNQKILEKALKAETMTECGPILYEWLQFFRKGHLAIRLNNQGVVDGLDIASVNVLDREIYTIDVNKFKKDLNSTTNVGYEGIWETDGYKIGINKEGANYIGFIIESSFEDWKAGQVKLKINRDDNRINSIYYMRDYTEIETEKVRMIGKNHLQIGDFRFSRLYPKLEEDAKYAVYLKSLEATKPFLEVLNDKTLYFRIPSFQMNQKASIDSVIVANRALILETENLILDIRNGTGGSDMSYQELLPLLYTNPIRTVGVEFLSTKLNNQRMFDFSVDTEYGFDEEDKLWFKKAYEELENELGTFVNLNEQVVGVTTFDTVHKFPKNVGIIINEKNGSTDEQFLLAAKQSKKVKLFGTTTSGMLDVSNMYFVGAPCEEFQLGYTLSRSMRIPDFIIDDRGIQPDFYLDRSVPVYDWVEHVKEVLGQ